MWWVPMGHNPRELVWLSRARQALAKAVSFNDIKNIRDTAQLAKEYAKKKGLAQEIIMEASAIKVEAERKLGQLLRKLSLANSSSGNQYTGNLDRSHNGTGPVRLRDLGISKYDSSRAQRIARLPQATFDRYVKENVEAGREPTTAGALRLARELEVAESVNSQPHFPSGVVGNLDELIEQGRKFSTFYADPPWPYKNQGTRASTDNHYPTMPVSDICAEPVAQLAADRAHLHLWVTNGFLREAFDVIEAWGFQYAGSCLVWVKPQIGLGNFWRGSNEILLLGVKKNLAFQDRSQRSWIEHDRIGHSKKPAIVRDLIEKVSPPPFLELYGRNPPPNSAWTIYGNQVGNEDQP